MRRFFIVSFMLLFILIINSGFAQKVYENRDEIPQEFKWNLNDIYDNWDEWENGLKELESKMDEVVTYKGKIKQSADNLLEVKQLSDDLGQLSDRVYLYPYLNRDLDTRNQEINANLQKVQILWSKFSTATSWINPEILEVQWDEMKSWLDKTPELKPYRFGIEDLYRQQAHVLDAEKEELLSFYSQFNLTPRDIYSSISTADMDFPEIVLSTGDTIKVTNGNYGRIMATNTNQEDRKLTFDTHYGVYESQKNSYASIYNAVLQKNWANAQARNYKSSLEAKLDGNNIPVSVYENLVNTVRENTEPLQRYARLRKKILGLEKYHPYDGSIPIIDFNKTYSYEQAQEWVYASVEPLGDYYQSSLNKAIEGGWIDVFENTGKRSGAYSASIYSVHPYMLMNYNETIRSVFTLAHELGHTMHSMLANENQPYSTADYTIFVAEVASTFNERLLLDYLLERTEDPKERIALLQQSISAITGTFFFQTLLADFELQAHRLVEQGKPITAEILTGIMREIFEAYYGDSTEKEELLYHVWARIPHMYRTPFYVYQYATCFASSAQLYDNVKNVSSGDKQQEIDRYLNLLKAGGSDYPMEVLRTAGVDLSKPEPVKAVIKQMDMLVSQMEKEVAKLE